MVHDMCCVPDPEFVESNHEGERARKRPKLRVDNNVSGWATWVPTWDRPPVPQQTGRVPNQTPSSTRRACELPVELWEAIFAQLPRKDLDSLTKVNKYMGAIAESLLYREVKLAAGHLVSWTGAITMAATHRATAVRCLTISMDRVEGLCESANATICLAGALASLPDLRELTVACGNLHEGAVRDILKDAPFSRLRRFACDCDALILASWPALARQSELEEFRGLYSFTSYIPTDVNPRAWPNLRVMDAGATFVSRLALDNRVTHLSVHVPRATARGTLSRIVQDMGHQLVALRVTRTILCPHSGGCDWALPVGGEPYWESDSPVVLCEALQAPRLQFLEVRDKVPNGVGWTIDVEALRRRRSFGASFRTAQWTRRTPSLQTVLWRPVWISMARSLPSITRDRVLDTFALLPVRYFGMPQVDRTGRRTDDWNVWVREQGSMAPRPSWWELGGTVLELSGYAPFEEMWATHPV